MINIDPSRVGWRILSRRRCPFLTTTPIEQRRCWRRWIFRLAWSGINSTSAKELEVQQLRNKIQTEVQEFGSILAAGLLSQRRSWETRFRKELGDRG